MSRIPLEVEIGARALKGLLGAPENADALVIFAHGSGSGRLSSRNTYVAEALRKSGLATLLLDLLAPEEEIRRSNVFDIPLLAKRLSLATAWAREQAETARLPIGYFGASTGAGAALVAAADDRRIFAVVSRGGRPISRATLLSACARRHSSSLAAKINRSLPSTARRSKD